MGVPLFYARNPNQFLYVYALTSAYRAGYRVYDPDYALSRDADIWEKVRRDPVILHALELRTHMIAGREWNLEPASARPIDKKAAGCMEELIKNIENFLLSRYQLAQGVATARTYAFISGARKMMSISDGPKLNWWRPCILKDVDRRRFYYEPVWYTEPNVTLKDGRVVAGQWCLKLKHKMWSVSRGRWEDWHNSNLFVKMIYGTSEDRLGYGRGLLEAIYFYHFIKQIALREGLQGLERWAQGMLVAKIDGLREASAGKNNDTIQAAWLNLLNVMRSRHVAAFDKNDEIEVVQNSGTGHQLVTEFITYLDNAITRLILGAVLPSGGGDDKQGSFARARVEADTMEALIQFDRNVLDESLTRDLVGLVWRLNGPQLEKMGLGDARMPRFRTVQEEREDPVRNAQTATMLLEAGIPLVEEEVYRKTGWSVPTPQDKVLRGRPKDEAGGGDITLPSLPSVKEGG